MMRTRMLLVAALTSATAVFACGSDSGTSSGASGSDPTGKELATVAKGEEAVGKRRCAQCHDSQAGKMAGASKPITADLAGNQFPANVELYPPNLTPDVETGLGDPNDPTKGYTDQRLADAIRLGKDKDDQKLCPQMQHFSEMTDFEVYSIIKYLRSLPPVKNKVLRSVCPPIKTKEQQQATK
ncbi:MAG: c-type cytochrome [Deltaproteobacteria bacterium]|nr:c-type cytochrome [Deltaproteobacteria bacterium]